MTDSRIDIPGVGTRRASLGPTSVRSAPRQLAERLDAVMGAADVSPYLEPAFVAHPLYRAFGKRALDVTLVIAFAPLALLLIGLAALALWIEGGNPFYHQERLGRDGARFRIFKLRTMVRDAERILEHYLKCDPALRAEWDATQKLKKDPRVTPIGTLLRATSLDELPQLWNVLRGEMSLIGPRPMLPEQLSLYGNAHHYFALRPGITGTWQVSKRNEDLFAERSVLDRSYDTDVSLRRDIGILWRTVGVVLRRTGY